MPCLYTQSSLIERTIYMAFDAAVTVLMLFGSSRFQVAVFYEHVDVCD